LALYLSPLLARQDRVSRGAIICHISLRPPVKRELRTSPLRLLLAAASCPIHQPFKAEGGHPEIPACIGKIEQLRDRDQRRHAPAQRICRQRLAAIDLCFHGRERSVRKHTRNKRRLDRAARRRPLHSPESSELG